MKCPVCQKDFEPNVPYQKYCSIKCRETYYRQKLPPVAREEFEFHCAHCGKLVVTAPFNDNRSVYCSRRCHDRAHEQRRKDRKRRLRGNNGVSGGMTLSKLIWRERRASD